MAGVATGKGYRRAARIFALRFEDDQYDGLVVKVRTTSVGRLLDFMRFLAGLPDDAADLTVDTIGDFAGLFEAFAEVLIEWNLEDDQGRPVPATLAGVRAQDADFVMDIMRVWFQAVTTAPAPLPAPSSAGARSAVRSLPMVPLSPHQASS